MYRKLIISIVAAMSLLFGCRPDYPNCDKDSHCHEGEFCVNSICQQCRDNGDCPEGQECQGGACREIPGYCTKSSDCADGQICRENRCGPCFSNSDCSDSQVCMDGFCGTAECNTNEECPAGLSCVNYRCQVTTSDGAPYGSGDCVLETIFFEFDSSELPQEMRRTIEHNYNCLKSLTGTLTLEGHCDPRGTTEYNMALGERRARIVSKVIKTLGLDASRVKVISKGKEEATGRDESGWVLDRKVVFK
jgi:peptidoglycan-associated lipoprotein